MPYAHDIIGVYTLTNEAAGMCYVGQSQRVQKRIREHFRTLRLNKHSNPRLQNAYNKYGRDSFTSAIEVVCEDAADLDVVENAFISGDACFRFPTTYNIAEFAKAPMRGKTHSEETRQRIRAGRKNSTFDYASPEYRTTLALAQQERHLSSPVFVAKLKFILDNPDMSYAARGRIVGVDTGSVRKKALRYQYLKGTL